MAATARRGRRVPGGRRCPHVLLGRDALIRSTLFAFATDFHDEGVEVALDRMQERAGVTGVTLAALYHHGRDIFPHNPRRRVRFLEGGAAFFRPDASRYVDTPIQPWASELSGEWDAVGGLREATSARDMTLHAWTVFCHNTRLGSAHVEHVVRNAFGDPQLTFLCPADPAVVAYSRALAGDLARYGCDTVLAESLHFLPLEHGYHHERYLIDIGPVDRLLLGLCFCSHCCAAATARGVDARRLRAAVADRLDAMFARADCFDDRPATREVVGNLWDGELGAFLDARTAAVSEAAAAVSDALAGTGTRLAFMDPAGGLKGYADGLPAGGPAPEDSWRVGVDPAVIATACDELQVLAYARDPQRVADDLAAYRGLAGAGCDLRAAFRPMAPDCDDVDNLAAKLAIAHEAGVTSADLYHYGLARLETLDLVRAALRRRPSVGDVR